MKKLLLTLLAAAALCAACGPKTTYKYPFQDPSLKMEQRIENLLSLLTPEERRMADILFLAPGEGDLSAVCAACAMEKSSVYRRRRRILEKVALAVWGAGEGL